MVISCQNTGCLLLCSNIGERVFGFRAEGITKWGNHLNYFGPMLFFLLVNLEFSTQKVWDLWIGDKWISWFLMWKKKLHFSRAFCEQMECRVRLGSMCFDPSVELVFHTYGGHSTQTGSTTSGGEHPAWVLLLKLGIENAKKIIGCCFPHIPVTAFNILIFRLHAMKTNLINWYLKFKLVFYLPSQKK